MYTSCLDKEKEIGECSKENTCNSSEYPEKLNSSNEIIFPNAGKKIPVKIILCENEEVNSTQNGTEPFENNSSGNLTPSPLQNLTENFIRFSSSNINNFSIGDNIIVFLVYLICLLEVLMHIYFINLIIYFNKINSFYI